jgi:hypothetical protein
MKAACDHFSFVAEGWLGFLSMRKMKHFTAFFFTMLGVQMFICAVLFAS